MTNKIQIWNPIAKSWTVIDTDTDCIIKRSEKPVEGIERIGYLEMAH